MRRGALSFAFLLGVAASGITVKKLWLEKYRKLKTELDSSEQERELLYGWLRLNRQGASLTEYFTAHGCKRVAVFGMGRIGRLVADALGEMAVYGVEQTNFGAVHERLTVYRLGEDLLPPADSMIICDCTITPEQLAAAKEAFPGATVMLTQLFEST